MNIIDRKSKYSRANYSSDKKINYTFDLVTLNFLCSYIMTDNRNIRRSHIMNIRNVFDIIDPEPYKNNIELLKRYNFIKKGLEARLDFNLKDPNMIIKHINGGLVDDSVIDINNFKPMSNDELDWVNKTISDILKHSFLYNDIDTLFDLCTRFKTSDYTSKSEIVKEFERAISDIQSKFRKAKAEKSSEMTFSLRDGVFQEVVTDLHDQLVNPANRLYCGMRGLNEMTGGFESGRVYMFFGLPGVA